MRIRYLLAACSFAVLLFSACSTINVSHVDSSSIVEKSEGIYYALPKTVVQVAVTVERTDVVEGPFSTYASKYLGLSDVITENKTSYAISSVNFDTYSIPDPEQYYFIETGKMKKKHLMLNFGDYAILEGVNNGFAKWNERFAKDSTVSDLDDISQVPVQNFINPNIAEAFDTIIEKINLDSTVIVKKTLKKIYVEKTNEQKAKEAADFIMEVEQSRIALLTGYSEVNYSKETIEYMADKLEKLKVEYLNLFTGITVKHSQIYYFTYIPQTGYNEVNLPLLRFSDKYGICDTSDYKGESVYFNLRSSGSTTNLKDYELSRMYVKEKNTGISYRIPEKADLTLIYNDKQLATSQFMIAQLGAVSELQAKGIRSLSLDSESGSIEKIVYGKRGRFFFHHH
jgi:hypothetical protein